jgi:two-component system response regulator
MITKRALRKGCIPNRLCVVRDGVEALRFLRKKGRHKDAPTPAIVLLDLRLPKLDGFEVLSEMKKDPYLKGIPTIILTSSGRDDDIEKAYNLGCNNYIVKPVNFDNFIKTIVEIKKYWLYISKIPII